MSKTLLKQPPLRLFQQCFWYFPIISKELLKISGFSVIFLFVLCFTWFTQTQWVLGQFLSKYQQSQLVCRATTLTFRTRLRHDADVAFFGSECAGQEGPYNLKLWVDWYIFFASAEQTKNLSASPLKNVTHSAKWKIKENPEIFNNSLEMIGKYQKHCWNSRGGGCFSNVFDVFLSVLKKKRLFRIKMHFVKFS
jgi:hypothetical protein